MTRPVLICAIDQSEHARRAVRVAEWLGRELDVDVVLAHAFDPLDVPTRPRDEMVELDLTDEDLVRAARVGAESLLVRASTGFAAPGVTAELVEGLPAPALQRLAAERQASLLVTGTSARAGLERVLSGSVSSAVAAGASCPVVVVPPRARIGDPGPVVAGYDGSPHSLRAARHAAALAARIARPLLLVHVTAEEPVHLDDDLLRELDAAGAEALGGAGEPLDVRLAVEDGDPVQTLAVVAAERSAALVVAGTRGRTVLSSALLGSVSGGLVRAARRPVVLVPPGARDVVRP